MTFQNPSTLQSYKTDNPISTPIYAAVTYKVLENVSVGFSFTTPYGSHLVWDKNWEGREVVQELNLRSFFFQPMISVKLAPWMSVGVSYIHATGKLDWTKSATLVNGEANLKDEKQRKWIWIRFLFPSGRKIRHLCRIPFCRRYESRQWYSTT